MSELGLTLDWQVAGLVFVAAGAHAGWNALVKATGNPSLGLATVSAAGAGLGLALVPFAPWPSPRTWGFLALSALLHTFYQLALARAYTLGDLSFVYPIARGASPIGVTLLGALIASEVPTPLQAAGIAGVGLGIAGIALTRGARVAALAPSGSALLTALLTGGVIALYSAVDGLGVRSAPAALSFVAWQMIAAALGFCAWIALTRRHEIPAFVRASGLASALGGVVASAGYGIVVYAMSRGSLGYVSALRETSVVFAAILGARFLGEGFGRSRVLAAGCVAAGIALLVAAG